MPDTLTVPTAPALSSVSGVEIAQTGTWNISTGTATFTTQDFMAAVAALDCPAVRRPVLKLGHTDPRFDGQPAVGWIDGMGLSSDGVTLSGDYVGMPGWLGPVIASAYPDRSMEARWDFMCQIGHVHPFVITAVALLGVTPPGIGTLESLQDIATLYGVAASEAESGNGFSMIVHAKGVSNMPNPAPIQVAAGVTTEDVRRGYYDNAPVSAWISSMELDPLQLIVTDDATGQISRVPVTLNGSAFEFGDPVPVEIQYVDTSVPANASASRLVYASRDESRPAARVEPPTPSEASEVVPPRVETTLSPAEAMARVHQAASQTEMPNNSTGDSSMDPILLRRSLGLAPEASDVEVRQALASALPETPPAQNPETPPAQTPTTAHAGRIPEGMMLVDSSVISGLQESARKGDAAFAEIQKNRRDQVISAAISSGKFPPARKEHYEAMWAADPVGAEKTIDSLHPGLVPVGAAAGYPGTETYEEDQTYYALYAEEKPSNA